MASASEPRFRLPKHSRNRARGPELCITIQNLCKSMVSGSETRFRLPKHSRNRVRGPELCFTIQNLCKSMVSASETRFRLPKHSRNRVRGSESGSEAETIDLYRFCVVKPMVMSRKRIPRVSREPKSHLGEAILSLMPRSLDSGCWGGGRSSFIKTDTFTYQNHAVGGWVCRWGLGSRNLDIGG